MLTLFFPFPRRSAGQARVDDFHGKTPPPVSDPTFLRLPPTANNNIPRWKGIKSRDRFAVRYPPLPTHHRIEREPDAPQVALHRQPVPERFSEGRGNYDRLKREYQYIHTKAQHKPDK